MMGSSAMVLLLAMWTLCMLVPVSDQSFAPSRAFDGSMFTIEELQSMFGPDGCIEGVLVTMPPAPVIANTPLSPQATAKSSPVLVSTEGEVGAQSGQQRPQLLQHNGSIPNNLANTKEKTPMCLVNELARFNKIQHQYRLTNEQGPAHKKRFTVTLKLGDEEYASEGASIKKAQHSAAAEALQGTRYKHPPPKSGRIGRLGKSNVTPTVELNALAMKRGEPAVYTFLDPPGPYMAAQSFNYRGMYNQARGMPLDNHVRRGTMNSRGVSYSQFSTQRYHQYNKSPTTCPPSLFRVSLRVGAREYLGEGPTPQAARHDAASKAVNQLKTLPVPEESLQHCEASHLTNGTSCSGLEPDPNSDLKSPISLVHEIALKRNLAVVFEVVSEKGPPHMRTFVTKCTVGDRMTTGEGNGKKVSKKRAAEKMLEELRKLPPTSPTNMATTVARMKRKSNPAKKKTRNLIKVYQQEQKAEPEYGEDINPISRLIQIQQAKKEREPVYSLLEERGVPRRREFVMEVSVGQHSHTGIGFNKRQAKRAAAEGLLQQLGYSRPPQSDAESGSKGAPQTRKVTFMEGDRTPPAGGTSGRQLVPGLLLMSDSANSYTPTKTPGVNLQTTATIAKELLSGGQSPTADALAKSSATKQQTSQAVRPKDQLLYLAQLLGFQVQFSDFPKGNHSEFLSLVSLSTEPPQVCHGAGSTTDASHDQAALTALRALSEMGLDYVAPTSIKKEGGTQGDGLHLSSAGIQKPDVGHSLSK